MKYGAVAGWGIVIYAVMVLTWSFLAAYGLAGTLFSRVAELLVLIAVATIAGRRLHLDSWSDILPYSFAWALVAISLDGLLYVPVSGWGLYADWNIWFGYALVAIVPLLAPCTRRKPEPPPVT